MSKNSPKNPPKVPPAEAGVASPGGADSPRGQQPPSQQPRRQAELPIRLPRNPVLRFSPTAWAKLSWFCLHGETEIGGFGISDPADPLRIIEFATVRQQTDWASISFDDDAVADFFDGQVDLGRKPEQFARIWIHCHPGDSPTPSGTDEETFARVFGHCNWALMFIRARTGKTYARLRFNIGPGGQVLIPTEVDYLLPFHGADHAAWEAEYQANIQPFAHTEPTLLAGDRSFGDWGTDILDTLDDWPNQPVAKRAAKPAGREELDAWADLLVNVDPDELDWAGEQVAARWGMPDRSDWANAAMKLPLDQQELFRLEIEAVLAKREQA